MGVPRTEDFYRDFNMLLRRVEALERLTQPDQIITDKRLPENPFDGQTVLLEMGNGITWVFRYNGASASAFKWEAQNSLPMYSEVTTSESTSSSTYVGLTTPGPSITVPFPGDYYVSLGARIISPTAGSDTWISYSIGTIPADDADGMNSRQSDAASGHNIRNNYMRMRRKDALGGGNELLAQYKTNAAGGASFGARWLSLLPIRVR